MTGNNVYNPMILIYYNRVSDVDSHIPSYFDIKSHLEGGFSLYQ